MIKNFQELVSQIKTQVPIQELISEFITIKKSGRGYVALCPFHDDHKPSLQIHPQKGIFKCFSCGTGGDLIAFYALINKKKWSEAVPELAIKYGLKVEYGNEDSAELQIKNQLYDLNKESLKFFKNNLFNSLGKDALIYLKEKRQITDNIIEKFELGFAQNAWDSLYKYLSSEKGYTQELIIASGLIIPRENQAGYYDRFRNRVIFPIFNETNNIIGFGGRALLAEDVKYINSPETLIFNKGQNLYGLNFAKEEIKKINNVVLTEGYLDVITAHQSGLINTVATLGTALTNNQLRLLTKYSDSKTIYLCMDTDSAGKKAVESIFRLTQEVSKFANYDIRVVSDLPGKDLDESLQSNDISVIREKVKTGKKLTEFIIDRIAVNYNTADEISKKRIMDELLSVLIEIKDPIEQNDYTKYTSHITSIEQELISLKLKDKTKSAKYKNLRFQNTKVAKEEEDKFKMHSLERYKHAEIELLSLYIGSFPHKTEDMKKELDSFELLDEKHLLIKEFIDNISDKQTTPQKIIDDLILEFNEYKHIMSLISDIALRIESDDYLENSSYLKNKDKIISEAKTSIQWWVTNKQKMKTYTTQIKDCKNKEEEIKIISDMLNLLKKEEKEK